MFGYRVRNVIVLALLAISFVFGSISTGFSSIETGEKLTPLIPQVAADGQLTGANVLEKIVVLDPNPSTLRRVPLPEGFSRDPATAKSAIIMDYIPNGQKDRNDRPCITFPKEARTAVESAAAIWANIVQSSVPIVIRACWSPMESPTILGSCGSDGYYGNFSGAKRKDTAYVTSLANAMRGEDPEPDAPDMHITYNSKFDWYYGTDGNTPSSQVDLLTVVLHEIAHGLNFSGGMVVQDGVGYNMLKFPVIYDTFIKDSTGKPITSYSHDSTELADALTSDALYFTGSNAMTANGGKRVRMYAPYEWQQGSSYSHLNNDTYKGTSHQMMTSSVSFGESIHDPGTITKGLLKDLGWNQSSTVNPAPPSNSSFPLSAIGLLTKPSGNGTPPPTNPPTQKAYWGAGNDVCCGVENSEWSIFGITSQGVTRKSQLDSCTSDYSWQGWVPSTPGSKTFSWVWSTSGCGFYKGEFTYDLQDQKGHFFYAKLSGSVVEVWVQKYDSRLAANGSDEKMPSSGNEIVEQELVDVIPVDPRSVATLGGKCVIDDAQ